MVFAWRKKTRIGFFEMMLSGFSLTKISMTGSLKRYKQRHWWPKSRTTYLRRDNSKFSLLLTYYTRNMWLEIRAEPAIRRLSGLPDYSTGFWIFSSGQIRFLRVSVSGRLIVLSAIWTRWIVLLLPWKFQWNFGDITVFFGALWPVITGIKCIFHKLIWSQHDPEFLKSASFSFKNEDAGGEDKKNNATNMCVSSPSVMFLVWTQLCDYCNVTEVCYHNIEIKAN